MTERQNDRKTQRQKDKRTERQKNKERKTERQIQKETVVIFRATATLHINLKTEIKTERQINKCKSFNSVNFFFFFQIWF